MAALADDPLDWRFKGLPASWWGRTPAEVCARRPGVFDDGATGQLCLLRADALRHNLETMADWCRRAGVELAPHGKTHMAPQLFARQLAAGACAITAATVSQVRVYRAFGVRDVVLANEVVDAAGLAWLSAELDADSAFTLMCWVDSTDGVAMMTDALTAAGARRALDVCVEVGVDGGRTGCRTAAEVDDVARAVAASPRLRLVGVAGYEAALGHGVDDVAIARVRAYLGDVRSAALRLRSLFETDSIVVTAGGSTYFDAVADVLAGDWRTIVRSGAYLTNDHGLYARSSPLTRGGSSGLLPALRLWAQVVSRPEPGLALLAMGRRDVSFDQDLPVSVGVPGGRVTKLNDQHAYLRADPAPALGAWVEFGVSHPCTTFDRWQLIPVVDADNRVVDMIRTFF